MNTKYIAILSSLIFGLFVLNTSAHACAETENAFGIPIASIYPMVKLATDKHSIEDVRQP